MSARQKKNLNPFLKKILLLTVVAILAIGITFLADHFPNNSKTPKAVVVIIGDSNSDSKSIPQVQKWSQDYTKKHTLDQTVYNVSLGGHAVEDFDNTEELKMLQNIANKIPPESKVVVVSFIGTNNAIMTQKIDSSDIFTKNYNQYLEKVRVILKPNYMLITSVPPAFPNPAHTVPFVVNFKAYELIEQFNIDLEDWVQVKSQIGSTHLGFVRLLPEDAYAAENNKKYLIDDGVHLNRSSQIIIFHRIDDKIQQFLQAR